MFKFACLLLCAVAVSLDGVAGEDSVAFHEAVKPFVMECAKEHGISEADFIKAKETHQVNSLKPCFIGCILKKFGIIDDKGDYDFDANLAKIKMIVKDEDHFARLSEVVKKCASVNDEPVSDGTAGCERAVLVTKCFMGLKSEMLI